MKISRERIALRPLEISLEILSAKYLVLNIWFEISSVEYLVWNIRIYTDTSLKGYITV